MGAVVLIGGRDKIRGWALAEQLAGEGMVASCLHIDVTDLASIAAAAMSVAALDILVNNAGISLRPVAPSALAIDELQAVLETNLFGAIRVTQAFLRLLRVAPAGRIVNVSSMLGSLHHLADPQWIGHQALMSPHSLSKIALNAFTALLAADLAGTAVKVNAVEPGYIATDMTRGQGFQQPADAAQAIVRYATLGEDGPTGGFFDAMGQVAW
jgi:NAD(P)-dependent dehydrogenase (short-subunit alcohol dehydrogenase family)